MKYILLTFLLCGCATTQCTDPNYKEAPNTTTKCDDSGCTAKLFHWER